MSPLLLVPPPLPVSPPPVSFLFPVPFLFRALSMGKNSSPFWRRYIKAVLAHVATTKWHQKHGSTADYIAALDEKATLQWVEDDPKVTLVVNGVAQKRVSPKNADIYRAFRMAHYPAMGLCAVALTVSTAFQSSAFTAANLTEMHWEKTVTASAALDHGKALADAIRLLRDLI